MSISSVIDDYVDLGIVPFLGVLLTPIALVLGWPVVAIISSGLSLLTALFCLGGFVWLPMLIIHVGGVACGVLQLMNAGGG